MILLEDHFSQIMPEIPPDVSIHKQIETVKSKVKQNVSEEFHTMWNNHIKNLVVQGKFLVLLALEGSHLSRRSLIFNLP
jgi:hypothetical protein